MGLVWCELKNDCKGGTRTTKRNDEERRWYGPDTWVTANSRDIGDRNLSREVTESRGKGDWSAGTWVTDSREIGESDGARETGSSRDMGDTEASRLGDALAEDESHG